MPYMNMVVLLGHMGKDPEKRNTSGGTSVANVSLATTRKWKKGDEWVEETTWHYIVVFGKSADYLCERGRKGDGLFVNGYLRQNKWTDRNGNEKVSFEVVADTVTVIPKGTGPRREGQREQAREDSGPRREPEQEHVPFDEDVPF